MTQEQIDKIQKALEKAQQIGASSAVKIEVGPDGVVRESISSVDDVPKFERIWSFTKGEDKYMIGLNCRPADDALRSQLGLDEAGLVVESVFDDTPAKKADIRKHDILIKTDDKKLRTVEELTKAVQVAGKHEGSMQLTVIREGKQLELQVTPAARKPVTLDANDVIILDGDRDKWTERMKAVDPDELQKYFESWRNIGPGIIRYRWQQDEDLESLKEQVEQLKEQLEELRKELKRELEKSKAFAD
jgi:hypothetical protein